MNKSLYIKLFISFSSIAFYLYIGFFTYYLTTIHFDPFSISILIGSTTLTNIFFGRFIGKFIDNHSKKFRLLAISQIISGCIIFLFSFIADVDSFFITLCFVMLFSICLSLSSIITTQYLITHLNSNYDVAYSTYSRITSIGLAIASLFLASCYDRLPSHTFFGLATILYFCSVIFLFPVIAQSSAVIDNEEKPSEILNIFPFLRKHLLIVIPICCVAFTESSFNINFEVIAFSLKTTPLFIIFLFGLISGILDWITSYFYPKYISPLTEKQKWQIFMGGFIVLFSVATILEYFQLSKTAWFLPILAVLLEIMGISWGIFIAAKVRALSSAGNYGQTMAIFRIPRAIITFLGILGIGAYLNQQNLTMLFLMNTLLFILTSLLLICKKFPKSDRL